MAHQQLLQRRGMCDQGAHAERRQGADHPVDPVPVDLEGHGRPLDAQVMDTDDPVQTLRDTVGLGDERGARHVAKLRQAAGLDDAPLAHDRDPVRQGLDLGEDMAGQQNRATRRLHLADGLLEDCLHQRIEAGSGLVEQQQVHVRGERGDQRHLLPIALGVGAGLLGRVQIEAIAQIIPSRPVPPAAQPGEDVDRLAAGEVRPELDVTGYVGEPPVQRDGVVPGIAAQQTDGPAVGAQQSQQHAHRRRLSGTVRAQEAVHLARRDLEVQSVQCTGAAEGLDQASRRDHGGVVHGDLTAPSRRLVRGRRRGRREARGRCLPRRPLLQGHR